MTTASLLTTVRRTGSFLSNIGVYHTSSNAQRRAANCSVEISMHLVRRAHYAGAVTQEDCCQTAEIRLSIFDALRGETNT